MKQKLLFLLCILSLNRLFSQQTLPPSTAIHGKITSEEGFAIAGALVVNTTRNLQTTSDAEGNFIIKASAKDDVRFAKALFDREEFIVSDADFSKNLTIVLKPAVAMIEEVKIFDKTKLADRVQASVGLPKSPEKPREKVADVKKDLLKPLIRIPPVLNVQAMYDVLSGKARRMKSLYQYEDFQEGVAWLQQNIDPHFFNENRIPEEKISEFFIFAFAKNPRLYDVLKSKNLSQAEFILYEVAPEFAARLQK